MKVLFSLSVLNITLALCQAACFYKEPKRTIRNGVLVTQKHCIDPYDGNKHPPGSEWNTEHCMRCDCHAGQMRCCGRYFKPLVPVEGCKLVLNPETCQYEKYRIDNPSELCYQASATHSLHDREVK